MHVIRIRIVKVDILCSITCISFSLDFYFHFYACCGCSWELPFFFADVYCRRCVKVCSINFNIFATRLTLICDRITASEFWARVDIEIVRCRTIRIVRTRSCKYIVIVIWLDININYWCVRIQCCIICPSGRNFDKCICFHFNTIVSDSGSWVRILPR